MEDPSVPGTGFDLDGNGTVDVPTKLVFGGGFDAPSPLRKDVYVEVDSYDCKVDNCPPFDPMVHELTAQAKTDLERMLNGFDISLHIVDDEHVAHKPSCDQPPAFLRGGPNPAFGTKDQRALAFGDLIRAKELAFRYAVFGHSTLFDDGNPCDTPNAPDLITTSLFGVPGLPNYDNTPFGSAVIGGRDMIVSLSPLWICPSDVELPNPALLCAILPLGHPVPPFARICTTRTSKNASLFPARVIGRAGPLIHKPYSRLLGVSEEDGTNQLLGRTFAHLLGHLLGLSEAQVANHPQQAQAYPPAQPYLRPDPYPGAASIKLGGDSDSPLFTIDANGPKLRFTPRIATGNVVEDTIDDNPIGEAGQIDSDGDGVIEDDDNCTGFDNADQADLDGDGVGDACDPDVDGDDTDNGTDAHPADTDDDGTDNVADTDDDGDGVVDGADDCALVANGGQGDVDGDGTGDACDGDADGDGAGDSLEIPSGSDRLDPASTPEFLGVGDSCSDGLDNDGDGPVDGADDGCPDADGDTMPDSRDPCPGVADTGWIDTDGDGAGNGCDPDADGDGVTNDDERNAGSDPFHDMSTPETRAIDGVCADGVDNDLDGLTDLDDPRCLLASKLGPPVIRAGFDAVPTPPNDDDTSGPVPLGFEISFGGQTFDETYVNNNGNLTFEGPLADFIPFELAQAPDPIVAPFFADVDTREGAVARYGTGSVDGRPAFGVTWPGVGCYPRNTSLRDVFQAILVDRSDGRLPAGRPRRDDDRARDEHVPRRRADDARAARRDRAVPRGCRADELPRGARPQPRVERPRPRARQRRGRAAARSRRAPARARPAHAAASAAAASHRAAARRAAPAGARHDGARHHRAVRRAAGVRAPCRRPGGDARALHALRGGVRPDRRRLAEAGPAARQRLQAAVARARPRTSVHPLQGRDAPRAVRRGGPQRARVHRARGPPATGAGALPHHGDRDRRGGKPLAAAQRPPPRAAAVAATSRPCAKRRGWPTDLAATYHGSSRTASRALASAQSSATASAFSAAADRSKASRSRMSRARAASTSTSLRSSTS